MTTEKTKIEETKEEAVWRELGDLPAGAIVTEANLAQMFGRCGETIKRAVERGELPPPVKLFGKPVWTVGVLLEHIEGLLRDAMKDRRKDIYQIDKHRP